MNINYYVYSFIDYVEKIIATSDIVITKAGTSSIFENLLAKKPIIIFNYIHGQEKGTKDFVVKNKLGYYINSPRKLAKKIEEICKDRSILKKLKNNLEKQNIKSGTKDISEFILNY